MALFLDTSALTPHEVLSAVCRKVRMGECTSPQATAIRAGFRDLMAESLRIVPLDPQVIRLAYDLMERHALDGLRPLDAVQLATCLVAQGPTLALADRLLARIARREGVTVCLC